MGIPIFWRRIERVINLDELSLDDLQKSCATVAGTPILFRRPASDVIVFREQAFGGTMHYVPIMHGVIRRRTEAPTVELVGLVKWWPIALCVLFAVLAGHDVFELALYPIGFFAIIYLIQSVRYARIAKALRKTNTAPEGATA
jgi:hypothetical protein